MKPRIYHSPQTSIECPTLKRARRVFVNQALQNKILALVRERGFEFEVTFNHGPNLSYQRFGNFKDVEAFLLKSFPRASLHETMK